MLSVSLVDLWEKNGRGLSRGLPGRIGSERRLRKITRLLIYR